MSLILPRQLSIHATKYHHPESSNVLLTLFAPDYPTGGIEYGVSHAACGVVSGNCWEGWFTATVNGEASTLTCGEILCERDYYFHLPESTVDHKDLHTLSDSRKFLFVPKVRITGERSIMTHLLIPPRELGLVYHNRRLKPVPDVISLSYSLDLLRKSILLAGFINAGVHDGAIDICAGRNTSNVEVPVITAIGLRIQTKEQITESESKEKIKERVRE